MAALDTIPTSDFKEHVESKSVSVGGAAIDSGRSVRQWRVDNLLYTEVPKALTTILGATQVATFDGRIHRIPPLADPLFQYWYADAITNIQGDGKYTRETVGDLGLEVPPFPEFAAYDNYVFTVQSTPRPYSVAQDDVIRLLPGSWYPDNDPGPPALPQTFTYANEWVRYTDFEILPQNDTVTSQRGRMVFQSTSGAPPAGPNGAGFQGMQRLFLPNSILRFKWFQVPYRYVSSPTSFLTRWRGRINQNPWYGFPAGSLLYLNFNPRRYTPPIPEQFDTSLGVPSTDKLCDLELTFLYTTRTANDLTAAPANRNFIQAGHNLLPWLTDRKFHFAMSIKDTSGTPVAPSWYSFPCEALFSDPDVPNGL